MKYFIMICFSLFLTACSTSSIQRKISSVDNLNSDDIKTDIEDLQNYFKIGSYLTFESDYILHINKDITLLLSNKTTTCELLHEKNPDENRKIKKSDHYEITSVQQKTIFGQRSSSNAKYAYSLVINTKDVIINLKSDKLLYVRCYKPIRDERQSSHRGESAFVENIQTDNSIPTYNDIIKLLNGYIKFEP